VVVRKINGKERINKRRKQSRNFTYRNPAVKICHAVKGKGKGKVNGKSKGKVRAKNR
jgi:hypothetical protein